MPDCLLCVRGGRGVGVSVCLGRVSIKMDSLIAKPNIKARNSETFYQKITHATYYYMYKCVNLENDSGFMYC